MSDNVKPASRCTGPSDCSLPWFPVGDGEYEVCTWPGDDAQERAEAAFRGWNNLGRPKDAYSIRKANVKGERHE